jgi:hypothetical protein
MSRIIIDEFQTVYNEEFIPCSTLTSEYVYDINTLSCFCSIVAAHNKGDIDFTKVYKFSKKEDFINEVESTPFRKVYNLSPTELCLMVKDS